MAKHICTLPSVSFNVFYNKRLACLRKIITPTPKTLLTKTTAARNGVALSYLRGPYYLAAVFVATIVVCRKDDWPL